MPIALHINDTPVKAEVGRTLFECAERVGIRVPTSCFKQGKCRECMMEVTEGGEILSPRTPEEAHLPKNFRLSCRARVAAEEGVLRCHTLRRGALRIEHEALELSPDPSFDPAVIRRGDEILLDGVPIAACGGPIHGIAADIGTTTVAMKLVDLETGQTLATQSFENPQRFAGTDVMARIRFDSENRGRLLQRVLTGYMVHAIESFPCDPMTIYEMVVVGNPTMRDLFFGLNVYTIGQRPYRSLTQLELLEGKRATTSLSATAKRLRLPIHPAARVYGLPVVSSHVGADAAACLLAVGMARGERAIAVMDIGTNTELLVGHHGKIFCASCPAGPAFEGGGVSCGMPAMEGAIERVALREDGSVETSTVGGEAPVGICGSGLIDLLSELLRTERMNTLGRLDGESDHFVVDAARPILFHESDINELAQAKGANVAGLRIVLEQFGMDFNDLDRFYLAGGFARHLNVEAGRRIGFIPNLPEEKFVRIGNAALEGAVIALRSVRRRKELEERVKTITHVELETHPQFFDYFVDGCQFVPVETTALGDGAGER